MTELVIFWCRRDFRLDDNPALFEAIKLAKQKNIPFLSVFILDTDILNDPKNNVGYPRKYYLARILAQFGQEFQHFIVFDKARSIDIFENLAKSHTLHLFANFDVEPYSIKRDKQIKEKLETIGKNLGEESSSGFRVFKDQLSIDPNTTSQTGTKYSVFTPFKKAVWNEFINQKTFPKADLNNINWFKIEALQNTNTWQFNNFDIGKNSNFSKISNFETVFNKIDTPWELVFKKHSNYLSASLDSQYFNINLDHFLQRPDLSQWYFSESQANQAFDDFNNSQILNYKSDRDFIYLDKVELGATSRISTALKWGLVSVRTLVEKIRNKHVLYQIHEQEKQNISIESYVSELIWREFYRYILFHHPNVLDQEFQEKFRNADIWVNDELALSRFESFIKGVSGYKLVDASIFQLHKMGWMHNRSRMLVGSILSKNLGVDWRWGQDFFRAMLVDLDEASNNGGWQWAGSVGADPKPIRIFNPYLQAEKFDPNQLYQNLWLPENYNNPEPIVEHSLARQEALNRFYGKPENTTPKPTP